MYHVPDTHISKCSAFSLEMDAHSLARRRCLLNVSYLSLYCFPCHLFLGFSWPILSFYSFFGSGCEDPHWRLTGLLIPGGREDSPGHGFHVQTQEAAPGALQGALRPRASSPGLAVYLRQLGARLPDPDFSSSVFTGPSALARKCRCSSGSCHVPSGCPLGCLWHFCTFKPSITTYAWVVPSVTSGFTFILSSLSALLHIFRV